MNSVRSAYSKAQAALNTALTCADRAAGSRSSGTTNSQTGGITSNAPGASGVTSTPGYSCGRESRESDSNDRKSVLFFLISAEETISLAYLKDSLVKYFQPTIDAAHTTKAAKDAALKNIQRSSSLSIVGAVLDFGTQILSGETFASAGIKTAAHVVVGFVTTTLVGLTALTGGAALGVAVVATIGLNLLVDYAYDKYLKEAVDELLPYSLYG